VDISELFCSEYLRATLTLLFTEKVSEVILKHWSGQVLLLALLSSWGKSNYILKSQKQITSLIKIIAQVSLNSSHHRITIINNLNKAPKSDLLKQEDMAT